MKRKDCPVISCMDDPPVSGYYYVTESRDVVYLQCVSDIYAVAATLRPPLRTGETIPYTKYNPALDDTRLPGIRECPSPDTPRRRMMPHDTCADRICDSEYWNQTPEEFAAK